MKKADVISKMGEFIPVKEKQLVEKTINTGAITLANVRDRLIGLGKILEESLDENYYIVNVAAGVAIKNAAIVLIEWSKESISLYGYAKEGLINQHTADKAITRTVERITK